MDIINYHSNWAFATLLSVLIAIISAFTGVLTKRKFGIIDRKFTMYALIAVYFQLFLGVLSYTMSGITKGVMNNFGTVIKDATLRLFSVEHPLVSVIVVVFITIGYFKVNKASEDKTKFNKIIIFYSIGLLLMLSRIPWRYWIQY